MNSIMKSGLAAIAAGLFSLAAHAEGFKITGTVKGLPDSCRVMLVNTEKSDRGEKIAEGMADGDSFTITGNIDAPAFCQLRFFPMDKNGKRSFPLFRLPLMASNDEITISTALDADSIRNMSCPAEAFTIAGGEPQRQYNEYLAACGKAFNDSEKAAYLNASKWFESNDNPDTMAVYNKIKADAYRHFANLRDEFIKAHPSYFISAVLTAQEMLKNYEYTGDELKAMRKMMKAVPDTARQNRFDRILPWALNYCKAMPCPDIEFTSDSGKVSKLLSLKEPDKYTFIDIWASWCGPCRAAIPHVKELQKKYGDRLQIISISADEEEDAWRKAMDQEKMTWAQYRFDPETQLAPASKALNLSSIPRLILLNEKGEIICSTNLPKEVTAVLESKLGK